MYYFDNQYLKRFIDAGHELKVFVDGIYLTITNSIDVAEPTVGYGIDVDGELREFDYRYIEQIKFGDNIYTKDMLQKAEKDARQQSDAGEEQPDGESGESGSTSGESTLEDNEEAPEEAGEEAPGEEADSGRPLPKPGEEEEEPPQESFRLGSGALIIDSTHPRFNNCGTITSIDEHMIGIDMYVEGRMSTVFIDRKFVELI